MEVTSFSMPEYTNLNSVNEYNKFLSGHAMFEVKNPEEFNNTLLFEEKKLSEPKQEKPFIELMGNAFANGLNSVDDARKASEKAEEIFAMGGDISVHEVMIAAEKASLSTQMAIQIRNRILNTYTELSQMQL